MAKRELIVTIIFACCLVGLQILGFFFPTPLTWGFHYFGFLPPVYFSIYLLLAAAIILHILNKDVSSIITKLSNFMRKKPYYFLGAAISIFIISAYLLRVRAPLLGDGFFLVKNFSEAFRSVTPLYPRNEPLATFYFYLIMKITGVATFSEFMSSYLFADIILGIGFIITVFYLVRNLFSENQDRFFAFIFLLVIPYMQLFFGYIETYAVVLLSLSIYILIAILYLKKKVSFTLVMLTFLLMSCCHYLTLSLLPSLIYLAYREISTRGVKSVVKSLVITSVIILLLLWSVDFEIENISAWVPHSHFLPIVKSTNPIEAVSEVYTFFSLYHASDLLNYIILLFASSIFILILVVLQNKTTVLSLAESKFFWAATLPVLVLMLIIKYDLGAAKDWDVFAPFAFSVAVFGIFVFLRSKLVNTIKIFSIVITLTLLHTLSYTCLNSTADASVRRYLTMLNKRTVSNFGYYASTLHLALYYHQVKNKTGAVDIWKNYVEAFPEDGRGYRNTITNLKNLGPGALRQIAGTYDKWLNTIPSDTTISIEYSRFCFDAGNNKHANGLLQEAIRYYQKAIELMPNYSDPYLALGNLYEESRDTTKAIEYFNHAARLNNAAAKDKLKQINMKK